MRAKHKLTELSIKQAIKKVNSIEKTIKISDGGGMYLQIQPNGSKYWRMNCRINGKQITPRSNTNSSQSQTNSEEHPLNSSQSQRTHQVTPT